ncbi:hypothetical protein AAZX31_05G206600 [Glycine max]
MNYQSKFVLKIFQQITNKYLRHPHSSSPRQTRGSEDFSITLYSHPLPLVTAYKYLHQKAFKRRKWVHAKRLDGKVNFQPAGMTVRYNVRSGEKQVTDTKNLQT